MSRHTTQAGPGSEFFLQRVSTTPPVAAESLVAWYPFRDGDGSDETAGLPGFGDTTDYSATVNGATYKPSGGVTDITTGANSGAFEFDGIDDTLDLGTVADSDQSLTVMGWVQLSASTSDFTRILTKVDGNNIAKVGTILLFLEGGTDKPIFRVQDGNSTVQAIGASAIPVGGFAHLAGRIDIQNGEITLFRDGQAVASKALDSLTPFSSQPWRIGADDPVGNAQLLDGTVDGTRIYTTALSDNQINQIYLNTEP
jgi:hypothetical protein